MPFFSTNYNSFGLDISELSLKAVELKKIKNGFLVSAHAHASLTEGIIDNGNIKNREELAAAISRMIKNGSGSFSSRYVACCLPEIKSYIKMIRIPHTDERLTDPKKLMEEIRSQMTNHIPIPLEEAHVDWHIVPSDPHEPDILNILAGAVPKTIVKEYTETLRLCQLVPIALEIEAQSIIRALYGQAPQQPLRTFSPHRTKSPRLHFPRSLQNLLKKRATHKSVEKQSFPTEIIVDSGATRTSCILWSNGTIQFTSSHNIAGNTLTKILAEQMKIDINEAEKTKKICGLDRTKCKGKPAKILNSFAKELSQAIRDMIAYHASHTEHPGAVERIILVGGNAHLSGLADILSQQVEIPVITGTPQIAQAPSRNASAIPSDQILSYFTAIGLALRGKPYTPPSLPL